ncbi:hypothetical protein HBDW_13630 [Herbaspirillum sp. DW155]|uniref:hypothetical protein n=1 Tax=Herbaspirillum sp. DW155 TaxID=3095609 RepID=UPI00308A95BF|nr:hypothetical protein HBDW_13630 [Herbaspirillum sp. DW155]
MPTATVSRWSRLTPSNIRYEISAPHTGGIAADSSLKALQDEGPFLTANPMLQKQTAFWAEQ